MSRYVKISTISSRGISSDGLRGQAAVDRMISHWRAKFAKVLPDEPDLIVVPEACDRFDDIQLPERLDYYRARGDQVRDFFAETARSHSCYIAYSAACEMPDGTWRNSTQLIDRQGNIAGIYNKNHVVVEETTKGGILCGRDADVFETDFGKVACVICFDLNFDELRLKYQAQEPDLIVFCSMYHGGVMQQYWAYSCRSHFVGAICALPGEIISPDGRTLATTTNYHDFVSTEVNLDCALVHLDYNWDKISAAKNKYGPEFKMVDPGHLGSVLISSESEKRTIQDIVKEFEIELLDDYMTRSLEHHHNPENIEK